MEDENIKWFDENIINTRKVYLEDPGALNKIVMSNDSLVKYYVDENNVIQKSDSTWKTKLKSDLPSLRNTFKQAKVNAKLIREKIKEENLNIIRYSIGDDQHDVLCETNTGAVINFVMSGTKPSWMIDDSDARQILNLKPFGQSEIEQDLMESWWQWCYEHTIPSVRIIMDSVEPKQKDMNWYSRQKVGGYTGLYYSDYNSNNITNIRDLLSGIWRNAAPDMQAVWKQVQSNIMGAWLKNQVNENAGDLRHVFSDLVSTIHLENCYYYVGSKWLKTSDVEGNWELKENSVDGIYQMSGYCDNWEVKLRCSWPKDIPMSSEPRFNVIIRYK